MAKKPSLKDKVLTADKIEAAYQFLNKKTEPSEEAVLDIPKAAEDKPATVRKTEKPAPKQKPKTAKRKVVKEPEQAVEEPQEPNVRVTVDMPAQLHEDMKIMTIRRRETIRSFILKLIEKEVAKGR